MSKKLFFAVSLSGGLQRIHAGSTVERSDGRLVRKDRDDAEVHVIGGGLQKACAWVKPVTK